MILTEQAAREHQVDAPLRQWKWLTGEDFKTIDRERTVCLVSFSPLEVHGPHLPVVTDRLEARALSLRTAEILSARHPDVEFLELPPMYVATDVLPQAGSINFRASTIVRVVEDLVRSVSAQGFDKIWIMSFHGGPRHWAALEAGAASANAQFGAQALSVFSMLIGELSGGSTDLAEILGHIDGVTPELLEGDQHAGLLETSLMLHLVESYVKPYTHLPRNVPTQGLGGAAAGTDTGNLFERARTLIGNVRHMVDYYETQTYSGDPARATPELGAAFLDELSTMTADALEDVLLDRRQLDTCRSPLWPLRALLTNDRFAEVFLKLIGHTSKVW